MAVVRKLRQLRADLRRAGFSVTRQTGSHQTWQHPAVQGYSLTVAGADGADAQPYQERDVRDALARARAAREDERRRQERRET